MNARSLETLVLIMLKVSLLSTVVILLYQERNLIGSKNIMSLLIVRWMKSCYMKLKKVSAAKEAPEFLEYDYDENKLYQVEK